MHGEPGGNTEKNGLRARLISVRAAIGDRDAASAAVCRRLATLPELAVVRTVAGYAATPAEITVDAALRSLLARGVAVCLPWVDGATLGIGQIQDLDADVAPGWRDLREPVPSRRSPLRPTAVDAVLVPGVGFDRAGNRLGHGGGHYDRLLARLRRDAIVIGIAHDDQVVGDIPVESHDRRVDVLVTPTVTLRPPPAEL